MKHMNFPSSCVYAALANVLTHYNIDTEDYLIIKQAKIPYLFVYDKPSDTYLCGAMLQNKTYFDLYLKHHHLQAHEVVLKKEEVFDYLLNNQYAILGIKLSNSKHAIIFISYDNSTLTFLNPHRSDDLQDDYLLFTPQQLSEKLNEKVSICTIIPNENSSNDIKPHIEKSIADLAHYQEELTSFLSKNLLPEEVEANKERLLRPIGLDLLVMMKIVNEEGLIDLLITLQQQVFTLVKIKSCQYGFDIVSKNLLEQFFIKYNQLLISLAI